MLESLRTYLAYPFVRYALVAGVMIALCSSLLGVTLVLKRFSLIGDGLSHVAFGALAVASVLRLTAPMIFVLSRQESPGEEGLAHFCEHTTFKGTARRSSMQILNSLERFGGDLNAFTNKEDTVFSPGP